MRSRFKIFSSLLLSLFLLLVATKLTLAQTVDLRLFVAGPDFTPHNLSTGEYVHFEAGGGPGPGGEAVRQFKNSNYEQFFNLPDGIYRAEDTSWALIGGVQDYLCIDDGQKAIYTLYPGCKDWNTGEVVTGDGAKWAPAFISLGQRWSTQTHQITTIRDVQRTGGQKIYCDLSNGPNYSGTQACGQSAELEFTAFYPASSCEIVSNPGDMVELTGVGGPGTGDKFCYMKDWGLVGFSAPGFTASLVGEREGECGCTNIVQGETGPPPDPSLFFPCNTTRAPEWHSLRPYPGDPCFRDYGELSMMCGNDLITKETFQLTLEKVGKGNCEESVVDPNLLLYSYFCPAIEVTSNLRITINTDNAEFPIMGNTELVPNSGVIHPLLPNRTRVPYPGLTPGQRMNNYVSWYLQGSYNRAEEDILSYDPHDPDQFYDLENDVNKVINWSGPLNKLLPHARQNEERREEISEAVDSVTRGANLRHNQIVGCTIDFILDLGIPVPCYDQGLLGKITFTNEHRLVEWSEQGRRPPRELKGLITGEWWQKYQEWRGKFCYGITVKGHHFFICGDTGSIPVLSKFFGIPLPNIKPDFWASLWEYIPLSSTEDRKGIIESFISPNQPTAAEGQEVAIKEITFIPESPSDALYFAHMEEDNELADTLQNTYVPQGLSKINGNIPSYSIPPRCEIVETRKNPGDDLLGELKRDLEEQQVEGIINYVSQFDCTFTETLNTACFNQCKNPPAGSSCKTLLGCAQVGGTVDTSNPIGCDSTQFLVTCVIPAPIPSDQYCVRQYNGTGCVDINDCHKVAMTASNVPVGTPMAEQVFRRLVAADMSIFKMIYPRIENHAPVNKIEAIPGESRASYTAHSEGVTPGFVSTTARAFAGSPNLNRDGSAAKIFFPYIGSIQKYFLNGIQCALRPSSEICPEKLTDIVIPPRGQEPPPEASPLVNCNVNAPPPDISSYAGRVMTKDELQDYLDRGAQPFPDLVSIKNMVLCYNDIVGQAIAAGYDPALSLGIWAEESLASNYEVLATLGRLPVGDMGCTINTPKNNFQAQTQCFHGLFDFYLRPRDPNPTPICLLDQSGCLSLRDWALIFENGDTGCNQGTFKTGNQFPTRLRTFYGVASKGNGNLLNGADMNWDAILKCQ